MQSTKRAIITSAMALIICFAMLLGSTFAWFTDSVKSAINILQTGTLDAVLEYKTNWADEWTPVTENTKVFKDGTLYEPGYTEVIYLRVSNAGTLSFKYSLSVHVSNNEGSVNANGEEFKLSDYLQIGTYLQDEFSSGFNYANILMPAMFGTAASAKQNAPLKDFVQENLVVCDDSPMLPGAQTSQVAAIVLSMPESVGNEANAKEGAPAPYIELGVQLLASQYAYEYDSFDNQYDANTDGPKMHYIANETDLYNAFKEGGIGFVIDMHLENINSDYATLAAGSSLSINTNNSLITKQDDKEYAIINHGNLEITGNGTIKTEFKGSIENWGKLVINNLNIDVKGAKYGFHTKGGTVEITDLILTSERGGLNVINGSKVTINSADIKFTSYKSGTKVQNGYCIYAAGVGTVVTINDGDYRYVGTNNRQRILCAQDGATIIVNGGTFGKGSTVTPDWFWEYDSTTGAYDNGIDNAGSIIIYGGTFEFDPSAFVAEGYEAIQGEDGWWTVSKIDA